MDPMRPIITEIHSTEIPADSSLTLGLLVWTVHDVHSNPRGEILGQAFLSDQRRAAIYTAVVVPDLDGDGKEDIVVEHQYEDTVSKDVHFYTDVFLTTHILPVSVADSISADMASSTTITATRESGGWRYLHSGTCGEDAHEYPVYNVRGEVACTVRLTKSTGHGFLEPSTPLPPGSYWAVIGSCVVRL